jgi:undecaprenyl-diphosphatase
MVAAGIALAVGTVWGLVVARMPHADPAAAVAERADDVAPRAFLHARIDPQVATGLALTLAALAVVAATVVLGVFVVMIRGGRGVVDLDVAITRWAGRRTSDLSLSVFGWVTWLGSTIVVTVAAAAAAVWARGRWRTWSVAVFLALVVGGQFLLSNLVKIAVQRVRPEEAAFHVLPGPSFPSGHATAAAATWAALALVVGRGTSVRTRAVLAGAAAGVGVVVAASRVFLGAHWTSDTIGGLLLGWSWFAVCAVAFGGRVLRLGRPLERAGVRSSAGARQRLSAG